MKLTSLSLLFECIAGMNYYWGGGGGGEGGPLLKIGGARPLWPPWFLLPFMGKDSLPVVLSCMVTYTDIDKKGFLVMTALIKGFQVQSHTPDPAATLFYDEVGSCTKKWSPQLWPFLHK